MEPVQSLDELYQKLQSDRGFSERKFKEWIKKEQYDFECVVDDVRGDEHESDILKHSGITNESFTKMKALINGEAYDAIPFVPTVSGRSYETNDALALNTSHSLNTESEENKQCDEDTMKLIRILKNKMSNKEALRLIVQKIIEEQFDFENIVDDIEEFTESAIAEDLIQNSINDSSFQQFCDIVRSFNADDDEKHIERNNTPHKLQITTQHSSIPHHIDNDWDKVLREMRKYPVFSEIIYEEVVRYYKEQEHEIDDVAAETYDESEIKNLFKESLSEQQQQELHSLLIQNVNKVNKVHIATTNAHNPISMHLNTAEPEMKSQIMVDNEDGEYYQQMKHIKQIIERLHIEEAGNMDKKKFMDKSFIMLLCVCGSNNVQEMIDLYVMQTLIAYDHDTYLQQRNHVFLLQQQFADCFRLFVCETFRTNPHNNSKFKDYFDGLNVTQAQRFLGYGKFSGIIADLSRNSEHITNNNNYDDDTDDTDEKDIKPVIQLNNTQVMKKYKPIWDNYIYCDARSVQMYCLAFIITFSKHFSLECTNINNCAAILDISIPDIISDTVPNTKELSYDGFKNKMDAYMLQFNSIFHDKRTINNVSKREIFEHNMKEGNIACWRMDLANNDENDRFCNDSEPYYIGRRTDDIGQEIKDEEYRKMYDDLHLFWNMRVKRIFTKRNNNNDDRNTRVGIAVHKFKECIKVYFHFQGAVVRMQVDDICKWFRYLFKYRMNEINANNWYIVEKYLKNMWKYNRIMAHPNNWTEPKVSVWDEKQLRNKNWNDLDSQFVNKNLNLCHHVVTHIKEMKPYLDAYLPYLNQLQNL